MKLFSKDWWAKQLFKENLLTSDEVHNLIPGGLAKGKTINDIVKKYNSTLDIVKKQLKKGILEVLNEDNKREVGFCYLFLTREMAGIILPQPFEFYRMHQIKNLQSFLAEQGVDE